MYRHTRVITVFCLAALLFTACNREPDHMRYIPKDAVVVAGINLRSLGKKIAWNMITGSKLFKEMQKRIPEKNADDAISGIDKAGIDAMNTFYVYLKTGKTTTGTDKVTATALVPLSDAGAWEAYVKKTFPQATIQQRGDIRMTSMGNNMFAGWNKNVLIVLSVLSNNNDVAAAMADPNAPMPPAPPAPDMGAEMDTAFAVAKGANIKENANFNKLQNDGHDLSLWVNYELIMNQYMTQNVAAKMGGLSLNNNLWKGSAFACGFDFKKGKITGDLTYYTPTDLSEVYKEFGSTNADKDMLDRLPKNEMDMMVAMHLSPKGIKTLLEKTGYLGLANVGLATQNMNVDNVLDAFTGDMAFTVNHLNVHSENTPTTFGGQTINMQSQKTAASLCYVLKINKKENFMKLFALTQGLGLQQMSGGYFIPITEHDSLFVVMNDQYAIAANKLADANAILQGTNKGQKMPEAVAAQVPGHPFAMFLDIQQSIKNVDLSGTMSMGDSMVYTESRKLLSNVSVNGGEFKDNAMTSHMEVNFTNTEENSIIALLDFGMRISDAQSKAKQANSL